MININRDMIGEICGYLSNNDLLSFRAVDKEIQGFVDNYLHNRTIEASDKIKYTLNIAKSLYIKKEQIQKEIGYNNLNLVQKIIQWTKFSFFTAEYDKQKQLNHLLADINDQIVKFEYPYNCEPRTITNLEKVFIEKYKYEKRLQKNLEIIYDILGGKENYIKLPILDLEPIAVKADESAYDNIYFVKPEDMSAPIMRGIDRNGRLFFAILVDNAVCIYAQKHKNSLCWIGENDLPGLCGKSLIREGNRNFTNIEIVKELVTTPLPKG